MWPFRKGAVRSEVAGTVVSVRFGSRYRIAVQPDNGAAVLYFCSRLKAKPGKRVRVGTVLGYVE